MSTRDLLKDVNLFSRLPERLLDELAAELKPRALPAGAVLFNQGEPGEELIVVQDGQVAIFSPDADNPAHGQAIRVFQPGEVLGEMALIDQKPRSVSARAEEPSTILALHGDDFRRLLRASPELAQAVMGGLNDRIRYTTNFLEEVRVWVRRMVDGNYQATGADATDFADPTLAVLAQEFARMAMVVQQREDQLRAEVIQLRIEIDQVKRKKEADAIMGSEYYQKLKEQARKLREDIQS